MNNAPSPITPQYQQENDASAALSFVYDQPSDSLTALIRHSQTPINT